MLTAIGAVASVITSLLAIMYLLRPTWFDAFRRARKVLDQIMQEWKPDVVIGIGRSGGIWGGWLAGNLGSKPFLVVDDYYKESSKWRKMKIEFPGGEQVLKALEDKEFIERKEHSKTGNRILLVEGAVRTGDTFERFREKFSKQLDQWEIRTAVLYRNPAAIDIDFKGRTLKWWPERFPWHDKRGVWLRFLRNGEQY